MKMLIMMVMILMPVLCGAEDQAADAELKAIQKSISSVEKLATQKSIKAELKNARKQLDIVREAYRSNLIPNTLSTLQGIRTILYRCGRSETPEFQQNIRFLLARLWPFLIKTGYFRTEVKEIDGIVSIIWFVPEGTLSIHFPGDTRPGEKVSGSAWASPAELTALYTLTVDEEPALLSTFMREWVFPQRFSFVLRDSFGFEVIRLQQSLRETENKTPEALSGTPAPGLESVPPPREPQVNIEIPHLLYQVSSVTGAGGHMVLSGPFDGNHTTTIAILGDHQARVLVESPRRAVLEVPGGLTGEFILKMRENGARFKCKVQVRDGTIDPIATLAPCQSPE